MNALVSVFLAALTIPVFAADSAPFDIEAEKILELFLAAAGEQYPDIPQQILVLDHGLWVHCWSTRPNERVFGEAVEFRPCIAGVNFKFDSDSPLSSYRDRDGNCKVRSAGVGLSANLHPDGSITVGSRVRVDSIETDCENGADLPPKTSSANLDAIRFSVDSKRILKTALAAVTKTYPDIRSDNLYLSSLIHLMCNPTRRGEGIPGLHARLEPCFAKLTFGIPSQTTESR